VYVKVKVVDPLAMAFFGLWMISPPEAAVLPATLPASVPSLAERSSPAFTPFTVELTVTV
jgi:hypothetical protein